MENLLEIKDLRTYFYTEDSVIKAVEGLNLSIKKGEVLGLAGESACGKSITAYSVMNLISPPGKIVKGEVLFQGQDLLKLSQKQMQKIRGKEISIVFQEPVASLNPLYTVGFQIDEMLKTHNKDMNKKSRRKRIIELLENVGIDDAKNRMKDYPHNFSGGQAQRVMVAMSLSCNPKLLIADEPTTSLDVTIQAQIMDLFLKLRQQIDFTLILITHNLALCSEVADRVAIMYSGKIVELADREEIFSNSLHPYTKALFSSIPKGDSNKTKLKVIEGTVPDPADKPLGCHFHPRCPFKDKKCTQAYPGYREVSRNHWVSCYKV
ncbi:MAG: ABC transporter ATP-binding protein [Candidatus Omnitrophica bacterium]|nr:ABC transporter ATP-binding protein [Candidatus Omnitrophota bacterium]